MHQSNTKAQYKITVPFEKSSKEGGWYIVGAAAGIEVDKQGQQFDASALDDIVSQINTEPVPLKDWHNGNSILSEMGSVGKAWREGDQVKIEARLDEDHPSAVWLWKALGKGKQFGLSVHGGVLHVKNTVDNNTGRLVERLFKPFIDEVSLTTKPVWSPSFGTVIRKAIDEASVEEEETMEKETVVETTEVTKSDSAQPAATETAVEKTSDNTVDVANDTTSEGKPVVETEVVFADDPKTDDATSAPENVAKDVSKSDESEPSFDPSKVALFAEYYNKLGSLLTDMGLVKTETTSQDITPVETVEKSETEDEIAETFETRLEKAVNEKVESLRTDFERQMEELKEKIPAVATPAVLQKSEADEAAETIARYRTDPRTAMRLGFAAQHNELEKFNRGI